MLHLTVADCRDVGNNTLYEAVKSWYHITLPIWSDQGRHYGNLDRANLLWLWISEQVDNVSTAFQHQASECLFTHAFELKRLLRLLFIAMSLVSLEDCRRVTLIWLTYENCDQDAFLQPFFTYIDSLFFRVHQLLLEYSPLTPRTLRSVQRSSSLLWGIYASTFTVKVGWWTDTQTNFTYTFIVMGRQKVMSWESPGQLSSSATPETRREASSGRIAYLMTTIIV